MRLVIRPVQEPSREIDLTHLLTAAIADELWRRFGGNDQLNWLEAEMHLGRMVESVRGQVSREALEGAREAARAEARLEMDAERESSFLMAARMDDKAAAEFDAPNDHRPGTEEAAHLAKHRDKTSAKARWVRRGALCRGNAEPGVQRAGAQ